MGNKFDKLDHKHIAEGRYEEVMTNKAIYGDLPAPPGQNFFRMIVLEVISDPATVDKVKLSHYEHDLAVSNIAYASVAPRNSIIARRVLGQGVTASSSVMVLYPFFPPHLSMPAKPGEHVWVMFEHPDATSDDIGYWMCKIVQPDFVEDVNYTHADRQFDKSFLPGLSDAFNGTDNPVYEFRNGAVDSASGKRYTVPETSSIPADETAYEKLLTTTDASKQMTYEAVPRYRKRPGDIAFEGTNNALIVIGTDRTGPVSEYTSDPKLGQVPKAVVEDAVGGAGALDFVVGRGQTPDTLGKVEKNKLISGGDFQEELGKSHKDLAAKEGDVDFVNDRSRVLISQKTSPDFNFKIDNVVMAHTSVGPPITDSKQTGGQGEGAIVIKSDKIRLIAREDLVIMVNNTSGQIKKDPNGNVQDTGTSNATLDPAMCASVILRVNGDVIFTPGAKGVIKLGGDDANLAVLCTSVTNTGVNDRSGNVTAQPIVDSMGGLQGAADGLNGVFAKKVLLK